MDTYDKVETIKQASAKKQSASSALGDLNGSDFGLKITSDSGSTVYFKNIKQTPFGNKVEKQDGVFALAIQQAIWDYQESLTVLMESLLK